MSGIKTYQKMNNKIVSLLRMSDDPMLLYAAQLIEELMAKQESRKWIPVTERLPAENEMMLVCCRTKTGFRSVNRAYYMSGYWHGSGSMAGVTHWMPLPELPEEGEGEQNV